MRFIVHPNLGEIADEQEVFQWILTQKNDESIDDIDRETFLEYIDTKDFLAVVFCELKALHVYSIKLHESLFLFFFVF